MGLTIYYELMSNAATVDEARGEVAKLRERALELPFEYVGTIGEWSGDECDTDASEPNGERWLLIQAGRYFKIGEEHVSVPATHVIAFPCAPGEGCEPANFGLALYPSEITYGGRTYQTEYAGWSWHCFCKTQYASNPEHGGLEHFQRCHLAIVSMLDRAAEMGILGNVTDEGEFFETRDVEHLTRQITNWNQMVAAFAGRVKDKLGDRVAAEITKFPNFEHLEAKGLKGREDDADDDE